LRGREGTEWNRVTEVLRMPRAGYVLHVASLWRTTMTSAPVVPRTGYIVGRRRNTLYANETNRSCATQESLKSHERESAQKTTDRTVPPRIVVAGVILVIVSRPERNGLSRNLGAVLKREG